MIRQTASADGRGERGPGTQEAKNGQGRWAQDSKEGERLSAWQA